MSQLVAEEFIPTTFLERGVAVPFTTPLLNQARLRVDRNDRFEFLLPNFTGGKGVYVMAWKSLPGLMTVTLHDRLLFEEIEKEETQAPAAIRAASLRVLKSGVAGPEAARAAEAALDEDEQYLVVTQFFLVTELLKLVGIGAQDLLRPGMKAEDSIRLARQSLGRVAQLVKLHADELWARVETLSRAVAPVGLPQAPTPGRLRDLLRRLDSFRLDAERWADLDASDVAEVARHVSEVATFTVTLGNARMDQLDKLCADPKQIIHDEPRFRGAITEHVSRLSWLLDGWDFLVGMWDQSLDKPNETRQSTMVEISRLVPVIPKEELGATTLGMDPEALAKIQRRWVRMNEDWRTGSLDMDAVMRIERLKTATV